MSPEIIMQETCEVCVRAPIQTSMPAAAATDLEEEDTATILFSQNACVCFHFSERVSVFNVRDVKRVFLFSIFLFFCFFYSKKKEISNGSSPRDTCPGWPSSSFAYAHMLYIYTTNRGKRRKFKWSKVALVLAL
jgi:hypothetical protein